MSLVDFSLGRTGYSQTGTSGHADPKSLPTLLQPRHPVNIALSSASSNYSPAAVPGAVKGTHHAGRTAHGLTNLLPAVLCSALFSPVEPFILCALSCNVKWGYLEPHPCLSSESGL